MSDDSRTYPRFALVLDARVAGYNAETTNFSMRGTQLTMPAFRYQLVTERIVEGRTELLLILSESSFARIQCKVVYASDYDDECLLGLDFVEFVDDARELLEAYVREHAGAQYLAHTAPG